MILFWLSKIVDYLTPKYYNSMPLILKKNIISNQFNTKKVTNKWLIMSLNRNTSSILIT